MLNKKFKGVVAVALLSCMGLIACDKEVQAKPTNYDDKLVAFTEDDVYHNLVSIIEDAYRDGSLASAVLDKVLYAYANSVFGTYNRVVTPAAKEGEVTLKEAAKSAASDNKADADKFLEAHKAYWELDDDGNHVKETEYKRITAKWNTIEDRIARQFYNTINGGSYNTRGYFDEESYIRELTSQLYHVRAIADIPAEELTVKEDKLIIDPKVDEEKVFETVVESNRGTGAAKTLLHRANYQENYKLADTETAEATVTYVEDEIIPTIYRSLLVEQYLLDESYNNLGRSAARKINVLAISENSNNKRGADYLMKYFVREEVSKGQEITLDTFKKISNASVGIVDTTGHVEYLDTLNATAKYANAFERKTFTGYDGVDYAYYLGTDYGDMMENFSKIKYDINTTDASVESDFTGSYAYTADIGKEIKENELMVMSYTTDGWYSESSDISTLPDAIKSRLFNIGVANVLDNANIVDRWNGTSYAKPADESKLVAKINGKYYLKVASKESGSQDEDDILFEDGGKYYIVQIEEAVSGSKLSKDSEIYNVEGRERTKEDIINEVARIIATKDTYQTLSTKHWLEKAAMKYHDTKVYDYFKENYPDLFEDDD